MSISLGGRGLFLLLLSVVFCCQVLAQSTIVNVPSTQVVSPKDVYVEFDFISNYSHHYNGGFQTYLPRAVVGVGHNVEVGGNVSYTDGFGTAQPVEIQPNIKWTFYENEPKGIAAALGCIAYVPITHRRENYTFGFCYSVMSKKLRGNYGPKFTGGGYALVQRSDGNRTKGGVMLGYEQPLANRLAFAMDWVSGNNRFGYVAPALSFETSSRSSLMSGYAIGNQGRSNHAFFAFWGLKL